jgi:hypothetical protein
MPYLSIPSWGNGQGESEWRIYRPATGMNIWVTMPPSRKAAVRKFSGRAGNTALYTGAVHKGIRGYKVSTAFSWVLSADRFLPNAYGGLSAIRETDFPTILLEADMEKDYYPSGLMWFKFHTDDLNTHYLYSFRLEKEENQIDALADVNVAEEFVLNIVVDGFTTYLPTNTLTAPPAQMY